MINDLINYVGEHVYHYATTLEKKKKSINNLIKSNSIHGNCEKCNKCNITFIHDNNEKGEYDCDFCYSHFSFNIKIPTTHKNIEEYATNKILQDLRNNDIQKQMYIYREFYQELNYCSVCFEFYWKDKERNEYIELLAKDFPDDTIDYSKIYDDNYNFPAATCFVCDRYYCGFCNPKKYGDKRELKNENCDCHEDDCLFCENVFCCFTCDPNK